MFEAGPGCDARDDGGLLSAILYTPILYVQLSF